ncbi:MAG: hypothetical protein RR442_08985 [Muribaculaceae bacterium]
MIELVSIVLNALLGGGLIVTLVTLKSTRAKAGAEVEKLRLDNVEQATTILMTNIVEPLKKEINGIRKELQRVRKALEKAGGCSYSADCPVLGELRQQAASAQRESDRECDSSRCAPRHRNRDRARQCDDESLA